MFKRKRQLLEHLATIYEDLLIQIERGIADPKERKRAYEEADRLHKMLFNTNKLSYDAILAAATNILGIGLILNFEKLNVLATKAVGFVAKTKI